MAGRYLPPTTHQLLQMPMLPGGAGADRARREIGTFYTARRRTCCRTVCTNPGRKAPGEAGSLAWERGLPGSQAPGHRPNLASPHVALALALTPALALALAGAGASCARCLSPYHRPPTPMGLRSRDRARLEDGGWRDGRTDRRTDRQTGKQAEGGGFKTDTCVYSLGKEQRVPFPRLICTNQDPRRDGPMLLLGLWRIGRMEHTHFDLSRHAR